MSPEVWSEGGLTRIRGGEGGEEGTPGVVSPRTVIHSCHFISSFSISSPPPVFMSFPLCDHSHPNRPFLSLLLIPGGAQRAFGNTAAAAASVGKITQVIGAVVDVQVRTKAFLRGVGGLHPFII